MLNSSPTSKTRPTGRLRLTTVLIAAALAAGACSSGGGTTTADADYGATLDEWSEAMGVANTSSDSPSGLAGYEMLTWEDLVAPGFSGDDITAEYTDKLATMEDGSPEAQALYEEMLDQYDGEAVNDQLDGTDVELAGFVAPLTFDDDIVTEFLLVPFFGACIHVPPPPPHQTVLVTLGDDSTLTIEDTWGAVWVTGTLTVSPTDTDLATASYTITDATSGVYEDYQT